ncbi:50S ribosomal protein L13 [Fibrobacterota bacterium]
MLKKNDINRKWYLIDAKDQILGRISSKVAIILQGKHKPNFSTNLDNGDNVVLINAKDIKLTGNKAEDKSYFSHSTYPGGGKTVAFKQAINKSPAFPLIHSIKGMLPKNARGRHILKKLHVYADGDHPHKAQKPEPVSI